MEKNVNPEATPEKPGVNGKERGKKPWINLEELKRQYKFIARNGLTPDFEPELDLYPDEKLYDAVHTALKRNPETDLSHIVIKVHNQDVTLSGLVSEIKESRAIEAVVRNVRGVKNIFNQITENKKLS